MANQVTFEFLGQSFTFRTTLNEEDIKEILEFLEVKKKELENYKQVPTYKLAIWLLMQVAYEYVKLKKEKEALESLVQREISKLEEFLKEEKVPWGVRE